MDDTESLLTATLEYDKSISNFISSQKGSISFAALEIYSKNLLLNLETQYKVSQWKIISAYRDLWLTRLEFSKRFNLPLRYL